MPRRPIVLKGTFLLAGVWLLCGPSFAESRQLGFEDRVEAQWAIEEVYWSHRIWPLGLCGQPASCGPDSCACTTDHTDNCPGVVNDDQLDSDGDGFGNSCDCDDNSAAVFPGAPEVCDGVNNDCLDTDWPAPPPEDTDNDLDTLSECEGDCDDADGAVYPDAPQLCDGVNNDCQRPNWPSVVGTEEHDDDGDGLTDCQGDCNDTTATAYPGASELCDGIDNDCDGGADATTGCGLRVAESFPLNGRPYGIATTPDGSQLLVTRVTHDDLVVLDSSSGTVVDTLAVGGNPVAVSVAADGETTVVANVGEGTVSVVDLTLASVAPVSTGGYPWDVEISPDGLTAVIADSGNGVVVVDVPTQAITGDIDVGLFVWGIVVTPDGQTALGACPSNRT